MHALNRIFSFTKFASYLQSPMLLLTRLYWGIGFIMAGLTKFYDIDKVREFFVTIDIPQPLFNAFFVASTEALCGLLLAIGFLSRIAAIPLIVIMCVAYATAHPESLKAIFTDPPTFLKESPFTYLYASLLILTFGPGKFSLDYLLGYEKDR